MATSTLSNIFKAVKENLVPCPNNSCKGSNTQFYSAHGLEQHWSRFHKAPGCNFSQDKVVMGQNLLKKLHFDCVKELLDERFRTWSTKNKEPTDLPDEIQEFNASYGGITVKIIADNIIDAVKQFGLLLNAGGFVPKFSKHSTGIEVQVTCVNMETNFQMWYEDVVNMKKIEFTRIIVRANFVQTRSEDLHHYDGITLNTNELNVPELELTGDKLTDTLRTIFKIPKFRPYQREVIESLLSGMHTLGVLPTGSGKTLCFTLPAALSEKITFAVFPLNSLMLDMYQHFCKFGITCCMINQYTSIETLNQLFHDFNSNNPQTKIVLITPESIQRKEFQNILPVLAASGKLEFVVIDEIHFMAESSPDFRPDYKKLNFLTALKVPILGLTATATDKTVAIISETLGLSNQIVVIKAPAKRPNLITKVFCRKKKEKIFEEVEKLIFDQFADDCGIIYCLHQSDVMEISYRLTNRPDKLSVSIYYGEGLDQESRSTALHDWLTRKTKVLIATKAAGTGIDKPDVRYVIQIGAPDSVEEYCQQIGRGGRDGLQSHCLTFYRAENFSFHLKHLAKRSDDIFREYGVQRLHKMQQYLQYLQCRKVFISKYFGDPMNIQVECNQSCDNCIQGVRYRELPANDDIKKLLVCLQAICYKMKEPNINLLVKTFVGSQSKIVKDAQLHELNEHGLGSGLTSGYVEDLLQLAFNEDLIEERVPFNVAGKGKLSFVVPGKNCLDLIRGSYQKLLFVYRR